jgi:hypothetical protein
MRKEVRHQVQEEFPLVELIQYYTPNDKGLKPAGVPGVQEESKRNLLPNTLVL